MGWQYLGILFAAAAVLCAVGFYKYVYFLSVGYGFAVAGIGAALLILFGGQMRAVQVVQCVLFLVYGARLSGFLIAREIRSAAYRKTAAGALHPDKPMSVAVKAAIWLSVAALYVAQTSPVFFRVYNNAEGTVMPWVGVVLSAAAVCIEALADRQKSDQKAKNPDMVATQGLYRFMRCPNYFGEVLFWTGVFVSGFGGLQGWGQWLMAALGYVCIVFIMFNGAERLEKRQEARYGALPAYRAYADGTPILLPLVPLYHLYHKK